jgi:hypothetical protein
MLLVARDGWSVQAGLEKGRPAPDWYADEPAIHPEEEWYVQAFYDLSTCRNTGMSLGAIPWRDIMLYAEFHEIDDQLFPIFKAVITAMDATFLRFHDKAQKDAPAPKQPASDGLLAAGERSVERPGEVGPRRQARYNRGR